MKCRLAFHQVYSSDGVMQMRLSEPAIAGVDAIVKSSPANARSLRKLVAVAYKSLYTIYRSVKSTYLA